MEKIMNNNTEKQEIFHVEDLESRFEMEMIGGVADPDLKSKCYFEITD